MARLRAAGDDIAAAHAGNSGKILKLLRVVDYTDLRILMSKIQVACSTFREIFLDVPADYPNLGQPRLRYMLLVHIYSNRAQA
jgi:hypothetical protein